MIDCQQSGVKPALTPGYFMATPLARSCRVWDRDSEEHPEAMFMAQLIVRNLGDHVKTQLQRRARRHGRSMEEEVREILRDAVRSERPALRQLGTRLSRRFRHVGLDTGIPELHRQVARPADFTSRF
jgi:plasmid stability protein